MTCITVAGASFPFLGMEAPRQSITLTLLGPKHGHDGRRALCRASGHGRETASLSEFEKLVDQYARLLRGVVRRVCGQRYQALVDDVEQEIRLALWKRLWAGNDIQHPISYLYKVGLATSLAVIRRYRPEREELEADPAEPRQQELSGLDRLLPAERARLVEEVIASLEPDAGRALRGYLEGLSHRELAALYGWSPSVARHLVYRSIERLRSSDRCVTRVGASV